MRVAIAFAAAFAAMEIIGEMIGKFAHRLRNTPEPAPAVFRVLRQKTNAKIQASDENQPRPNLRRQLFDFFDKTGAMHDIAQIIELFGFDDGFGTEIAAFKPCFAQFAKLPDIRQHDGHFRLTPPILYPQPRAERRR